MSTPVRRYRRRRAGRAQRPRTATTAAISTFASMPWTTRKCSNACARRVLSATGNPRRRRGCRGGRRHSTHAQTATEPKFGLAPANPTSARKRSLAQDFPRDRSLRFLSSGLRRGHRPRCWPAECGSVSTSRPFLSPSQRPLEASLASRSGDCPHTREHNSPKYRLPRRGRPTLGVDRAAHIDPPSLHCNLRARARAPDKHRARHPCRLAQPLN